MYCWLCLGIQGTRLIQNANLLFQQNYQKQTNANKIENNTACSRNRPTKMQFQFFLDTKEVLFTVKTLPSCFYILIFQHWFSLTSVKSNQNPLYTPKWQTVKVFWNKTTYFCPTINTDYHSKPREKTHSHFTIHTQIFTSSFSSTDSEKQPSNMLKIFFRSSGDKT